MAKGSVFCARVEQIAAGGAGVARLEGKSVFIEATAPGDLVKAIIKKEHKTWDDALLLEVLEPSSQRTEPECPYYGICGGCTLQHLKYEAQVEAKTAILKDNSHETACPHPLRHNIGQPDYRNRRIPGGVQHCH